MTKRKGLPAEALWYLGCFVSGAGGTWLFLWWLTA